jgi:hypothetical protein
VLPRQIDTDIYPALDRPTRRHHRFGADAPFVRLVTGRVIGEGRRFKASVPSIS